MNIPEKEEAINELEKELKALKEQNNPFTNFMKKLGSLIDED